MDKQFQIEDDSGDKKYFTMLPNYILNHSTAIDQALYMQMKRVAGDSGRCFLSEKKLKKKLGIGGKTLKKSIAYLISRGWISLDGYVMADSGGGLQAVKAYRIIDIWKKNVMHYEGVAETAPPSKKRAKGWLKVTKGVAESETNKNTTKKEATSLKEIQNTKATRKRITDMFK